MYAKGIIRQYLLHSPHMYVINVMERELSCIPHKVYTFDGKLVLDNAHKTGLMLYPIFTLHSILLKCVIKIGKTT